MNLDLFKKHLFYCKPWNKENKAEKKYLNELQSAGSDFTIKMENIIGNFWMFFLNFLPLSLANLFQGIYHSANR